MKWKFVDSNHTKQIDSVGNIVQIYGGVIPKACQKCKISFNYSVTQVKKIQSVPIYKCIKCSFENASGDAAFDHKIISDHKITKTSKDRVVGVDNKILGSIANITKTEDDVIILCDDCND